MENCFHIVQSLGFDERFNRISSARLAKYYLAFKIFHQFIREDFYDVIHLPKFDDVVRYIFSDANLGYYETTKTSIFNQTINIFGELENLNVLSDKILFDLISLLSPIIRTQKIIDRIVTSDTKKEEIISSIATIRDEGGIEIPNIIHTLDDLFSIGKISGNDKIKYTEYIQSLYDKNIILRGKYFKCPHCDSNVWMQINAIKIKNKCPECNNKINIPITVNDYFKLNHLIIRAIDQGQLSTILLLYFLYKQNYYLDYISNIIVIKDNITITDIDLFVKIGRRIGILESKSYGSFEEKQIDDLLDTALSLKCDFVGFSTLLKNNDQKVIDMFNYIKEKPVNIPIIIITGDDLFNSKNNMASPFFEPFYFGNKYPTGPLFVCKLPPDYSFHRNLEAIVQSI